MKEKPTGIPLSDNFNLEVAQLRETCIRTLTNGTFSELRIRYKRDPTREEMIASLYSIYIQFSVMLLDNIDRSLKTWLFEMETKKEKP